MATEITQNERKYDVPQGAMLPDLAGLPEVAADSDPEEQTLNAQAAVAPAAPADCRRTARTTGRDRAGGDHLLERHSIRARLPRVAALLARRQPDLVCLQEIKVSTRDFPVAEFAALGYASAVHGQEGRNGVAMLARTGPAEVARGFDADPAPDQARVLSATVAGLRVVSVYVVNGQAVGTPEYALKLRWLNAFTSWLETTQRPGDPLLLAGDFNIAPDDRDVYDPDGWRGRITLAPG